MLNYLIMPAKLNTELLKERKQRLLKIMKDYGLDNHEVAKLSKNSYDRVKNWKHGSTFFTTSDEYYLLQMISKYRPEFAKHITKEISALEL